MRAIINPQKQKFVIALVAALVSFLGFLASSQVIATYQIALFLKVSLYVYLFLVFWQTFIFDLHLRKPRTYADITRTVADSLRERFEYLKHGHHWPHFQNYLILPGIIYWTTIVLLFLNPFNELLKEVWIVLSTLALTTSFWYLKTVFYAHREAGRGARQMIFLTKLYASFLAFTAALGTTRYFGYGAEWFSILVFVLSFLLLYQALFQHHFVNFAMLKFMLATGILLAACGYVIYFLWNVNFWSGALVLSAIYNAIWGIVHHKYIDNNLTRKIVYEYLAVLFVILVIVFSTTNFAQRI